MLRTSTERITHGWVVVLYEQFLMRAVLWLVSWQLLNAADVPRTAGAHILEELQRLFQNFLQRIPSEGSKSGGLW